MNNPLDLFAWKVRSERKRQHLTQKQLAERLGMNPRTIIDLETCQSNPKFETVVLVAKELNISVDTAIFPEMVNQPVGKKAVLFIDLLRHFQVNICQMQEIVAVHCQEVPLSAGAPSHGTRWAL